MEYVVIILTLCIPSAYWLGRRRAMRECEDWLKRHELYARQ